MSLKVYEYKGCGTCRKAIQFLDAQKIAYERVPIREKPPSKDELKKMLGYVGDLKKLFNTSGGDYKEMKLKDKLPSLTEAQAIDLLSKNGNLVKRPFVLGAKDGWVGFDETAWKNRLK